MGQHSLSTTSRTFKVLLIGAEQQDEISLSRLMGITRYRTRRYHLTLIDAEHKPSEIVGLLASSDIVMVNVNNPRAVLCWSRAATKVPHAKQRPVLRITHDKNPRTQPELSISWPINPTRVIQTLDRYTVNYLDFIPEFEIGGDESTLAEITPLPTRFATAQARKSTGPSSASFRVLVADDSLAVRRQLEMEFDRLGGEITLVADGAAALIAAENERFDIIFLDVIMPEVDGYTVCKRIRRSAINRQTPVVLLTSKSSHIDRLKGKLSGCDTYLTKPINHNEFCLVAKQHIAHSTTRNKGVQ